MSKVPCGPWLNDRNCLIFAPVARKGFHGRQGSRRAKFNTAIAANAAILIKRLILLSAYFKLDERASFNTNHFARQYLEPRKIGCGLFQMNRQAFKTKATRLGYSLTI
jgi:hypothetical protein